MNSSEIYDAIRAGKTADIQQAMFELLSQVEALTVGVMEVAGTIKLESGRDPLSSKSRIRMSEFVER